MGDWRMMRTAEQVLIIEDGRTVAYVSKHLTKGEREHHAALIVEAVNSHGAADELAENVEALLGFNGADGLEAMNTLASSLRAALTAYRASKEPPA